MFCYLNLFHEEANPVYSLGTQKERKQSWSRFTLAFSFIKEIASFKTVLLPRSGRIGVATFRDVNTLVEITKDGKAFPVTRRILWSVPQSILGGLSLKGISRN